MNDSRMTPVCLFTAENTLVVTAKPLFLSVHLHGSLWPLFATSPPFLFIAWCVMDRVCDIPYTTELLCVVFRTYLP